MPFSEITRFRSPCDKLRTAIASFACVSFFFSCSLCKKERMRGNGTKRRNGIRFRKGDWCYGVVEMRGPSRFYGARNG